MIRIYLASPFFSAPQVAVVEKLENLIRSLEGYSLYSPRQDGVIATMTPEEKKKSSGIMYRRNIKNIVEADLVLAVIDGRDQGTVYEIGYASAFRHLRIATYSDENFGVNVMLRHSVNGHIRGIEEASRFLQSFLLGDDAFLDFQNFNPVTT